MRVRGSRIGMTQIRNNYSGGVGEKSGRWMHRYLTDFHDCLLLRHTSEKVSVIPLGSVLCSVQRSLFICGYTCN